MPFNFEVKTPLPSRMLAFRLDQRHKENLCRAVEILMRKNSMCDCNCVSRVFHFFDKTVLMPETFEARQILPLQQVICVTFATINVSFINATTYGATYMICRGANRAFRQRRLH